MKRRYYRNSTWLTTHSTYEGRRTTKWSLLLIVWISRINGLLSPGDRPPTSSVACAARCYARSLAATAANGHPPRRHNARWTPPFDAGAQAAVRAAVGRGRVAVCAARPSDASPHGAALQARRPPPHPSPPSAGPVAAAATVAHVPTLAAVESGSRGSGSTIQAG